MFDHNEYVPYSFEPEGPEANDVHTPAEPTPPHYEMPPVKKHGAMKVVALALSCALVGGVGGGAMTAHFLSGSAAVPAAAQTDSAGGKTTGSDNVIVSNVVHTNTGDKELTPQEVYNKYVNAVVGITTSGTTTNIFGQVSEFAASGSGFVISDDGYVVTNHHVIAGATSVKVSLYDGTTYDAKVIGSDSSNDVALLKIEATGLNSVAIGDSDTLAVGDQVAAIGNPLGELTFSLTAGYISALDRSINTDGTPINMLQTDAAINSGNSGGPLFDMNGNVIGITTAKYSGSTSTGTSIEGIGFAIPINDVMSIVNDLKNYGYVTGQAYLGVSVRGLDSTTATEYGLPLGVYVADVTAGSCAEKAGMQKGDIITALGDTKVESYADLAAALKQHKAGETIELGVYRSGKTATLKVTLDEKQPTTETTDSTAQQPQGSGQQPQQPDGSDGNSQTVPQQPDNSQGGSNGFDPFEFFFGN